MADWDKLEQGDVLRIENIRETIKNKDSITAIVVGKGTEIQLAFNISNRQIEIVLKGGIINYIKQR
jgi:aconitate hydratase